MTGKPSGERASPPQRPWWQLPPGVTRGLWDYLHSRSIAEDYDEYFARNKLFEFDEQVLARYLPLRAGAVVADLGCGTGRALLPLARRGFRGLAIDLSWRMLGVVRRKLRQQPLPIQCLRTNLVQLDCVADEAVDHAICLFSTLGMIRGRANRKQALAHVHRMLRPGGAFVIHVHNYWYNLYDPGGPWWLLGNLVRTALVGDVETGDKFFYYRGVPNVFLHVFRLGEIRRDLRSAGFRVRRTIPLDPRRHRELRAPWLLGRWRANGWIFVCDKT